MNPTLFTLGYQQRTLEDFVRALQVARIDLLVDVRETAWSHKRGFSKSALREALGGVGIAYAHAGFAGNPKTLRATAPSHAECLRRYAEYLDAQPQIVDLFDELVGRAIDAKLRVCLVCYERHPNDCHRGILAERWRRGMARQVEHLGADGSCRLMPV